MTEKQHAESRIVHYYYLLFGIKINCDTPIDNDLIIPMILMDKVNKKVVNCAISECEAIRNAVQEDWTNFSKQYVFYTKVLSELQKMVKIK